MVAMPPARYIIYELPPINVPCDEGRSIQAGRDRGRLSDDPGGDQPGGMLHHEAQGMRWQQGE